jgi:anti-sigma B factor antagonist
MSTQDFSVSPMQPADGIIVVQVIGEIDMTNSLAFRKRLFALLDEGPAQVVVDLSAAERVDTTGLSVLWESAKRCRREDRELAIVCSEGRVRHTLANTGLEQVLSTYANVDEALGHDGPAP